VAYTPFDFNEAIGHRKEYVEERLREGSPVVGVSFDSGMALVTVRGTQRKIFEIYDRLIFGGIGNQSDIEAIRVGAIDVAHREGFERSPDDVTAQRLVGFALSPPLKRMFGDQWNAPAVVRGLFGELGRSPEEDHYFVLNYDGEFYRRSGAAVVAGTEEAESRMEGVLQALGTELERDQALDAAIRAWAAGAIVSRRRRIGAEDDEPNPLQDMDDSEQLESFLGGELSASSLEVGILDRHTSRESKFRLMAESELEPLIKRYR
jgi:proteasome alpha subunit